MLLSGIVVAPCIAHDLKQDNFVYSKFCEFGEKILSVLKWISVLLKKNVTCVFAFF